jgi:hypothetical protein
MCALLLNKASPAGTAPPNADDDVRALTLAIEDIFGVVDNTTIAAAALTITSTGLKTVIFQDAAADPTAAGQLQRSGSALKFYNSAARVVYIAAGTDVAVADGGTGLSSGTSGGVLYFSAAATLASSAALTAKALMIGGGAGAAPTTIAALTNGQLAIGSTGNNPVPAALTAGTNMAVSNGAGSITLTATDRVMVPCSAAAVASAGATVFLGFSSSATEADVSFSSPVTGSVTKLYTHASAAPGSGKTFTYHVMVNGSATAVTHVVSDTSTDGNSSGSAAISGGQVISVRLVGSAGAAVANHQCFVLIGATG